MKICVYGAGAIGGFLAARLARHGEAEVSVVARGPHLDAIRRHGITLETPEERFRVPVRATDDPSELGVQDFVFMTMKAHQVGACLDRLPALLGPDTAVLPPTTGIPFWYFHRQPGFDGRRLPRLDPGGRQWQAIGPERAIGCVYLVATEVTGPGVIHHDGLTPRFPLGEPDGSRSERVLALSGVMQRSGLAAPVDEQIRGWLWMKMISSLCWNPVATLTAATLGEMNARPEVLAIVHRLVAEADAVAAKLGVTIPVSLNARIGGTRRAPAHKMSMLQDLERGRPLEIDVLADSIETMREIAGVETPTIDMMLALTRLRAATAANESRD